MVSRINPFFSGERTWVFLTTGWRKGPRRRRLRSPCSVMTSIHNSLTSVAGWTVRESNPGEGKFSVLSRPTPRPDKLHEKRGPSLPGSKTTDDWC
jgi:hypothetical protein